MSGGLMIATGMSWFNQDVFGQTLAHTFAWWIWFTLGYMYLLGYARSKDPVLLSRSHRFEHRIMVSVVFIYKYRYFNIIII